MEYKRFQNTVILRLDPGEEVCSSILDTAAAERIALAEITALGAAKRFSVGVFDVDEKKYYEKHFEGCYEITSLVGTLTQKDGMPYLHLHMNAGDRSGSIVGGHLTSCVIGVTAEIVIRCIDGNVERRMNPDIGINQMVF